MLKTRFLKVMLFCICFVVLSSTAAFAKSDGGISPASPVQQTGSSAAVLEKQKEVDAYISEHLSQFKDKGFTISTTSPMDTFVEIGIFPYSEENAEYIYELFGKDMIKVIEGMDPVIFQTTSAPDTPVNNTDSQSGIIQKQQEIDKYLFGEYKEAISKKGFNVTYTNPAQDHVEIGIMPYSEENASFIYEIVGKDKVKVVEGVMYTIMGEGAPAADSSKVESKNLPVSVNQVLILTGITVLGAAVLLLRKSVLKK